MADRIPIAGSLAVSLCESQGHGGQEFIQGDVGIRGEFLGEHVGDHHHNAVRQDLQMTEETNILFTLQNSTESFNKASYTSKDDLFILLIKRKLRF